MKFSLTAKICLLLLFIGFVFSIQVLTSIYLNDLDSYPVSRIRHDLIIAIVFGASAIIIFPFINKTSNKIFGDRDAEK